MTIPRTGPDQERAHSFFDVAGAERYRVVERNAKEHFLDASPPGQIKRGPPDARRRGAITGAQVSHGSLNPLVTQKRFNRGPVGVERDRGNLHGSTEARMQVP